MNVQRFLRSSVILACVLVVTSSPVLLGDAGMISLEARGIQDAPNTFHIRELAFARGYVDDSVTTLKGRSPASKEKVSKPRKSSKTRKTPKSPKSGSQNQTPKKQSSKELTTRPPKKPATLPPSPNLRKSPSPFEGNAS